MAFEDELKKAMALHREGKHDLAEAAYEKLLEENPDDPNALAFLGAIYSQRKHVGIATQMFKRVVELAPEHFDAWVNLGNCHKIGLRYEVAQLCYERAAWITGQTQAQYADVWNNIGGLYSNSGLPEKGIPFLEKALFMRPDHPEANWNMALFLLEQGRYGEGFDKYEWGFSGGNRLFRNYGSIPPWDGSADKSIIVWGEQGIGDELMFASMLPDLIRVSKEVIFDCHPRLLKIFKQSFPGIAVYPTRKENVIGWFHHHKPDSKIAIGDLGRFFRRKVEDFPKDIYLKASDDRIAHYRDRLARLGDRLKIGISWTGGYKKTRKDYRSIPLNLWKPILECDADFISLQYTDDAYKTIADFEDETNIRIHHWPSAVQNDNYHETAALVSALDLVITVNTAVHHLAGGLGKECWTLTPKAHAWRYYSPSPDGTVIPWYPHCYQYLQKNLFDWEPIIKAVSRRLRAKIKDEQKEEVEVFCED